MMATDKVRWHSWACRTSGTLLVAWLVVSALVAPGAGAQKPERGQAPVGELLRKESPIQISSDRLEVSQKEGTVLFEGNVVAQQDNLTMTGKRLTIFAVKGATKGVKVNVEQQGVAERIDRIEVEGEVKIAQGDKMATCDKAVYYRQEQKIILTGSPRVSQGRDALQGRLITLYLLEERSVVEGGAQNPVQAVIYPEGKDAR
jgi:lipopolysaccharide export system protein LptA